MKSLRGHKGEAGDLQILVDELFEGSEAVSSIDVVVRAEIDDVCAEAMEVVELLPAGTYRRGRLCDQLNSIITAHGWGLTLGTVD